MNRNKFQISNYNGQNYNDIKKFSFKSKIVIIPIISIFLIIFAVLGISLGIHFGDKHHNNKPIPPTPNPIPNSINVNKKFLTLNIINQDDFGIPNLINGQTNHFATDAFSNLPNNKYYLDFSKQNNVSMKKTDGSNGYNYLISWDVKSNKFENKNSIVIDNYFGFYFKNKNDYSITDTSTNTKEINKYYYLNFRQYTDDGYFYINPDQFVTWPEGFSLKNGYLTIPFQKLDNLQIIKGNYTPNKKYKDISYTNKICWYDPDNEVNVTCYCNNQYLLFPNKNIENNQDDAEMFELDTNQQWDSQSIETVKLNFPGEKDYDLNKKMPIYELINSKFISYVNQNIINLFFYRKAVDENKKPLIFTLSVALSNKSTIQYTFNISDVPEGVSEFRLVWNDSTKEMHLFGYDHNSSKVNEIQMHKKNTI